MIFIASDHAGFQLKKFLVTQLEKTLKIPFEDLGPGEFLPDDDFPDYAEMVGKEVRKSASNRGILICGSGHGMCISANKIKGIRAILGASIEGTDIGRKDNDANVLCLSGRTLSHEYALAIVKKFFETEFDHSENRKRRLEKIKKLEG